MGTYAVMFLQNWFVLVALSVVSAFSVSREVAARTGDDATLQYQAPEDAVIEQLVWSRAGVRPEDGYVYFYRNKRAQEKNQHQIFKGRVHLRDPEMKNGDVSVILNNVSMTDTGVYDCLIITSDHREIKGLVNLTVTDAADNTLERADSDDKNQTLRDKEGRKPDATKPSGVSRLVIGLSVFGVILLVLILILGLIVKRKYLAKHDSKKRPANDENAECLPT